MKLRIKEICKEKSITVTALAEMLGVTQESMSRTINGNPTITTLDKIATALGVEITELFEQSAKDGSATCPHCGKPVTIKLE
ncbi:MAG: helix-turn-helix transcriptional regulator [Rikenellaceae bacterium]